MDWVRDLWRRPSKSLPVRKSTIPARAQPASPVPRVSNPDSFRSQLIGNITALVSGEQRPDVGLITDLADRIYRAVALRIESAASEARRVQLAADEEHRAVVAVFNQEVLDKDTQLNSASSKNANLRRVNESLHSNINDVKRVNESLCSNITDLKTQHETNLGNLRREHNSNVNQLKSDHHATIAHMEVAANKRENDLVQAHRNDTIHMQRTIQDVNDVLLTRDDERFQSALFSKSNLPNSSDAKIREQFMSLFRMVEDFSRTEWKESEVWTHQDLEYVGQRHGQRLVKKSLLQHVMFAILFQHVFCSPFRMLGDAGRDLEREWNTECGQDTLYSNKYYSWPKPSILTERWRYMTLQGCKEALTTPAPSSHDPRVAVKRGWRQSSDAASSQIINELSSVMLIGKAEGDAIRNICQQAATAWLDFAMHRCRIVVTLTGSDHPSLASAHAGLKAGTLRLTVSPSLGRYGNNKGTELESFEIIRGCSGDVLEVP